VGFGKESFSGKWFPSGISIPEYASWLTSIIVKSKKNFIC